MVRQGLGTRDEAVKRETKKEKARKKRVIEGSKTVEKQQ
jgi:hypothetical protein